jgi:mRNA interferase RelE/StbE
VYSVEWDTRAVKELQALEKKERKKILERVAKLGTTPRPPGCKKLHDKESAYRIQVGDYRVIYQIRDAQLLVLVVKVGNRRDVYR